MKDCPVCGKSKLADHLTECPQCNADLECFALLDSLYEAPEKDVYNEPSISAVHLDKHKESWESAHAMRPSPARIGLTYLSAGTLISVVIVGAFFLYHHMIVKRWFDHELSPLGLRGQPTLENKTSGALATAVDRLDDITGRLKRLEEALSALASRQRTFFEEAEMTPSLKEEKAMSSTTTELGKGFFLYRPARDDTLWRISRKYYGTGTLYPVLLEYNPGLGIYFELDYGIIKVLRDQREAKRILDRLIFTKGGKAFFRYKVNKSDTWRKISRNFYGTSAKAQMLIKLNSNAQFTAGERVNVPLNE